MRNLSASAAAVAILCSYPALAQTRGAQAEVYVLAGQSNMSGRGLLEELTPEERRGDSKLRVYGNDGKWRDALDPLDDATNQVDLVSADAQAGVGPGLFFAREISRLRGRPVVLIPCAKGGLSIGRWKPGGGRDSLYGSCLQRIREAGGRVSGILWYQGESDTDSIVRAERWTPSFVQLIGRFREDLGQQVPVTFVQLADPAKRADRVVKYPGWETLRQAQQRIAIRCTAMVSAAGLPLKDDELHLTTDAQRVLGRKLALAMDKLTRGRCK